MARSICRREVRSIDRAALHAVKALGRLVSVRTLGRRYAERRRELELAAMEPLVTYDFPVFQATDFPQTMRLHVPEDWRRWVNQAEALATDDLGFLALAVEIMPAGLLPHWNRRSGEALALLHLWTPAELLALLAVAGIQPEPAPESD